MRFSKMILLLLVVMVVVVELAVNAAATPSTTLAKPGCPHSCGHLTIPYPFGTRLGCCLNQSFLITCNDSKPFLANQPLLNISLEGELRVSTWQGAYACYNQSASLVDSYSSWMIPNFPFSYTKNKVTLVGCDTYGYAQSYMSVTIGGNAPGFIGSPHVSGCISLCGSITDVADGSCSGIGCCQASIPRGVKMFFFKVESFGGHRGVWEFNKCGFGFLAEEGSYIFPSHEISSVNVSKFSRTWPVVLDWAIGSETCEEARKNVSSYGCGKNSICYNSTNASGYRCNCSQGYKGNPYLPNGCQDINECLNDKLHNCTNKCINTAGSFNCSCPDGFHGNGVRGSQGCIPDENVQSKPPILLITLGLGITIALFVGCFLLYWRIKRRKLIKHREKLFQQNGGFMLQEQLSKLDSSAETVRIFTIEEVKKATNDFNENEIVGRGGFGTVYKGVFPQNKIVAIKKSSVVDQSQVKQFVNEVIVLTQINHRNVVKLLGCCLETEVPLLVYEFITNGTLYHHLHEIGHVSPIPWEIRLRIAKEIAGALAYLHSAASIPIIHRDVKSTNILLDDNFTAKVSDFGASRLIPLDKKQLTTMVQGTFGYLDPEYFHTNHLSEKSDTYSFGVVLLELLTSTKALSFDKTENERNLAAYFLSLTKENRLSLILDDQMVTESNENQICKIANIAQSCLRLKGDERPTMREVAAELEGLTKMEKHIWTSIKVSQDNSEMLLSESSNFHTNTAGYDSINDQDILPLEVDDGLPVSCPNLSRGVIGNASRVYQGDSVPLKWDTI